VAGRGPGIISADRPRRGSFASLVDRIAEDVGALDALVFAYCRLSKGQRWALAHAALHDAADPVGALAVLLEAEEDQALRGRLETLLRGHAKIRVSACLRGTPRQGEARLTQSVAGRSETLRVSWNAGEIGRIEIESDDASSFEKGATDDPGEVIDALAPLFWQHIRRGGRLPEGVERFAGFFSVARRAPAQ